MFRKNILKINLSSLAFHNYSLSYERSLTRKITFVAGYRFMPETNLGSLRLTEKVSNALDEPDITDDLSKITTSNNTYTGEFRFYGGRHPGARGLYLSLYGRYTNIDFDYAYDYTTSGKTYLLPFKGTATGYAGGVMLGAQWLIAKRITFDWYIIGGHAGKLKVDAPATADLSSMTAAEKSALQDELESWIEIGDKNYIEATVTDQGAKAKVDDMLLGIRGLGFCLGIAF